MKDTSIKEDRDYEKLFNRFIEYRDELHEKNMRRIKIGLRVNLILPQIFLVLCFVTESSKLFFLILWIISLFGIAFYLIYIEYRDHQMQGLLTENDSEEFNPLIGAPAELIESTINNRMDMIDDRIDTARQTIKDKLSQSDKNNDSDDNNNDNNKDTNDTEEGNSEVTGQEDSDA